MPHRPIQKDVTMNPTETHLRPPAVHADATVLSMAAVASAAAKIHPLWLRAAHWLNAFAVVLMVASGWRIYNASPIYEFRFPTELTFGGWLGGALQWHFAGMWLLTFNGLVYLALNLFSGRFARKFLPLRAADVWGAVRDAVRGRLSHADPRHYNGLQKLAYLVVVADLALLVLSGLVLWKSVQFPVLRELMGGYEGARRVHFFAMAAVVAFVCGHILMVALVPRTLIAMVRGR
jgi:thiosulfate reductase cytochrome b subunit